MLLVKNWGSVARNTCFCLKSNESLNPSRGSLNLVRGSLNRSRGSLNPVRGSLNPSRGSLNPVRGSLNPSRGSLQRRVKARIPRDASVVFKQKHVFRATLPLFLSKSTYSARRFRGFYIKKRLKTTEASRGIRAFG